MNAADFQRRRQDRWNDLAHLVDRLGHDGARALTPDEVVALQRLYRAAAADLATARTCGLDPAPLRWLNELCARAHGLIYRGRRGDRRVGAFFAHRLPALLWRRRARLAGCAAALLLGAVAAHLATARDPSLARVLAPDTDATLGTGALTLLSLRGLLGGMLLGVGALVFLLLGGAAAGASLALAADPGALLAGVAAHAPVGLLAAILAAAVGLEVGWAAVAPGARSRRDALGAAARAGAALLVAAGVLLLASLALEAGVSRSLLPAWLKVATGITAAALAVAYSLLGRRACSSD